MIWREAIEKKGLSVNAGKTKVMICGTGLDLLQSSGEYPCAVCRTGVGNNSIYCNDYKLWVHKNCSGGRSGRGGSGRGVREAQANMEETDGERLPFVCLVALHPKSTAMIMAGRSVHLTTLFPGQA